MKKNCSIIIIFIFTFGNTLRAQFLYPPSKEIPVVDDYFGNKITDNYRWLENLSDTTVLNWIKAQSDFSNKLISKINGKDVLQNRMKEYKKMGGDVYGEIIQKGNSYYYSKTKIGESLSKIYVRILPNSEETLLFDPETVAKKTQIAGFVISKKGNKIAMKLSNGGGEICSIRIFDIPTKALLPDIIGPTWSQFIIEFVLNDTEIMYTKLKSSDINNNELLKNTDVYLHKIGTEPINDKLLFSREKYKELNVLPEKFPEISKSDDNKFLFLYIESVKSEMLIYFATMDELKNEKINWKALIKYEDEITNFKTVGNDFYFLTHKNAPRFKIGMTNILNPNFDKAKIIVPQSEKIISNLLKTKDYLIYSLKSGITNSQYTFNLKTKEIKKIDLPIGTNRALTYNQDQKNNLLVSNTNWLTPSIIYEYDINKNVAKKSKWFYMSGNYPDLNKDFLIKEVEVKSHDGVMVPLSIIHSKNIKFDGNSKCYITGYGSYGSSRESKFSNELAILLEQGCVVAYTHVRGGGEKGNEWHEGGMKSNKPNTWKDFIACTEYMIEQKYTSPERIIGNGVSAGGILIGRAITERPDLYRVVMNQVGMTNILRSETTSNGDNQIPEFGSVKVESDFKSILDMDVQSKIEKEKNYPAVILRTGMNDARIVPWMPAKLAAVLQNSSISNKPVLLYVNYNNGHFTSDTDMISKEFSDMFSFAFWQVGDNRFKIVD